MAGFNEESSKMNTNVSTNRYKILLLELVIGILLSLILYISFGKVTTANYPYLLLIVGIIIFPLEYIRQYDLTPEIKSYFYSLFSPSQKSEKQFQIFIDELNYTMNKNLSFMNEQLNNSFQYINKNISRMERERETRFSDNIDAINKILFNKISNKELLSDPAPNFIYYYMGIVSINVRDFEQAHKYLIRSLELSERIGFKYLEGLTNFQLGVLFLNMQNHNEAMRYLKRSEELLRALNII